MTRIEAVLALLFFVLLGIYYGRLATIAGAKKSYDRFGNRESFMWFWLQVFNIPRTERNCTRLLRGIGMAGFTVAVVGILISLYAMLFGSRSG